MWRFLLRRLASVLPTLVGVTLLSFAMIHLVPGDPIEVRSGEHGIAPERLAQLRHEYVLDRPLWRQFVAYEGQVAQGDLGRSLVSHEPVWSEFLTLFPATLELSACAMLLGVGLGIPLGVVAATRRGSALDYGLMGAATTGVSLPIFWLGLMLILVFSVGLGWTPVSGEVSEAYYVPAVTGLMLVDSLLGGDPGSFGSVLGHLVLPTLVLGTLPLAVVARMTRSAMLEVLGDDFIRTARAKGLSPARVVVVHGLRNALIPVVTVIGLTVGSLLGGAILTETVFSWPGIGRWLVEAIERRDYPVLQGGTLLVATLVVLVNLGVDLLYGVLDPRRRG